MKSNRLIWLGIIMLATLAVYARTLDYGTVNWDEPLAGTTVYQERPGLRGVREIFKPTLLATYQPVREVAVSLLAPFGAAGNWVPYHMVSLAFYLGTILFLYLVAAIVIGKMAPEAGERRVSAAALGAAALFALHPSHAETIAWVSGQKDAFVAFFYLGSLYFYIRHEYPSLTDYLLCLGMFLLALGSKPSGVSLPLVLVAYDWTMRGASDRGQALRKLWPGYLPFAVPAFAAAVFFMLSRTRTGALLPDVGEMLARLVKAAAAAGFSMWKLLLPVNLCLRYPEFKLDPGDVSIYLYGLAGLALVVWTVYAIMKNQRVAFLLSWFLLGLAPNSNLVKIVIERADRYYYLSSAAFAILAAWMVMELFGRSRKSIRQRLQWTVLAVLPLLGAGAWQQAGYWKDGVRAWSRTFELYPRMVLARLGLASSYLRENDFDRALEYYKPLLEGAKPNTEAIKGAIYISRQRNEEDKARQLASLGHALDRKDDYFMSTLAEYYLADGDTVSAGRLIDEWMEINPNSAEGLLNQANLYRQNGELEKAEQIFRKVIGMNSSLAEAYIDLGRMKQDAGEYAEAERVYLDGLNTGRLTVTIRQLLAGLYVKTGRNDEALAIYSRYAMDELNLEGLEFMGAHYFSLGEFDSSLVFFQQMAIRNPKLPRAYSNSAVVLEKLDRIAESDSSYAMAISLDSSFVDAWYNWGSLAESSGDLNAAISRYTKADSLAGGVDREVAESLIRVLIATGDISGARRAYDRFIALSGQQGGAR